MKKKWLKRLLPILAVPVLVIVTCNAIIEYASDGMLYSDPESIPPTKVGLVLGTARHRVEGGMNPFYRYRIEATLALFRAGKIAYVLVSGDNGSIYYNEPDTIKKDLIAGGIPAERIFLDYAGFRTLDSMVRAKVVFGLDSVTVISQEFHNKRALYIARQKGLHAQGFNARGVGGSSGIKMEVREYFARVKVFLDLVFNTQPRFYGNRINIE
ncbi:vancomycin high temperature exclusion protein [Robiginitalea sp. SC105]|uniref:SanA/YdcF family protein n=1 Tax=Robiginitalea sp. SC105 TaxID=2762332 RepID=UPI00163A05D4|nr:ElyC/SanA/YdcF family protein [Robiginitalea sp. SC105]MBC2838818.1 YdcF family protein [Robiginitalea sp. SC105]